MYILALESSCDETAVAIIRCCADGGAVNSDVAEVEVLANCVASQIDVHKVYGGVVAICLRMLGLMNRFYI